MVLAAKNCSGNQQRHCWIGLQGPDIGQIGGAERQPEVLFQKGRQRSHRPLLAAMSRELPKNRGLPWRRVAARELSCSDGSWERRGIVYSICSAGCTALASTDGYADQGGCTARRRGQRLAAARVAKGAAETVDGVCRPSIICERIGDAGTGHARAAFPSTIWHKLRCEEIGEQC